MHRYIGDLDACSEVVGNGHPGTRTGHRQPALGAEQGPLPSWAFAALWEPWAWAWALPANSFWLSSKVSQLI